jgi:hypothetical protein
MTTLKLILKSTVDDHALIELAVVVSIENFEEGGFGDPGNAIRLALLEKVWQRRHVKLINIHDSMQVARRMIILPLHDIPGVLEHTQ